MFKHNLFIITCLQRSPLHKRQTSSFCFNHALLKLKSSHRGCPEATLSSVTNEWCQTECLLLYSQPLPSTVPFPRKYGNILFSHLSCRYVWEGCRRRLKAERNKEACDKLSLRKSAAQRHRLHNSWLERCSAVKSTARAEDRIGNAAVPE